MDAVTLERLVHEYRLNGDNIICSKCLRSCEHMPDTLISHALIMTHEGLAVSYATKSSSPRFRHDLISELFLSLVKSVKKAQTKLKDNNITPYILTNFRSAKSDFFARQKMIRIPRASRKRNKLKEFEVGKISPIVMAKESRPLDHDVLTHLAQDEVTNKVLTMVTEDYQIFEIALELNVPRHQVYRILKGLRSRAECLI
jgi:hypothetical protein